MRRPSLLTRAHWTSTLPVNHLTEFQLLLQTFAVGLQDIVLLQDFMCFASGQTGNAVKLATGFASASSYHSSPSSSSSNHNHVSNYACLIPPAISLGAFVFGVFTTGRLAAVFGPRKRLLQVSLGLVQMLGLTAAALVLRFSQNNNSSQNAHHTQTLNPTTLPSRLSLALLSAATASQIAAARAWDVPEITTAMATGAVVDLFNDPRFFARQNRGRDLRVLFLVVLVAGCASAAGLRRWVGLGASGILGVSIGVKGVGVGVLGGMVGRGSWDAEEGEGGFWGERDGDRMSVNGDGAGDALGVDVDVEEGRRGRKPG